MDATPERIKTTRARPLLDALYITGLLLGAPWLLFKAATTGKYLKGTTQRFGRIPRRRGDKPCVWFHTVSVGELVAAEPVIRRFHRRNPDVDVLISVITRTGHAIASRRFPDFNLIFFPLDLSWIVARVLDRIRPSLVVLVELELWPNFLMEARSRRIPVLLMNGRISERSSRHFALARPFLEEAFRAVTFWGVQTPLYRQRLLDLGIPPERVRVLGNTKYDTISTRDDPPLVRTLRAQLRLPPDHPVIIAGSTFPGEEQILLDVFRRLKPDFPDLKLIIAPRHPERLPEVTALLRDHGDDWQTRTCLRDNPQTPPADVILLDTMGELAKIYACGDVVFVGKSLTGAGGQNMLEPAARAKAVLFGPNVANFQESVDLLLADRAAVQVPDPEALQEEIRRLLLDPARCRDLGQRARRVIDSRKGATDRYLELIERILGNARKEDPGEQG